MSERHGSEEAKLFSNSVKISENPLRARVLIPNFSSYELFGSSKELTIEHEDQVYRLRVTKQGKLILNK